MKQNRDVRTCRLLCSLIWVSLGCSVERASPETSAPPPSARSERVETTSKKTEPDSAPNIEAASSPRTAKSAPLRVDDLQGEYEMTFEIPDEGDRRLVKVRPGCYPTIETFEDELILIGCGSGRVHIDGDETFRIEDYSYVWQGHYHTRSSGDSAYYLMGELRFGAAQSPEAPPFEAKNVLAFGKYAMRLGANRWADENSVCWPKGPERARLFGRRPRKIDAVIRLRKIGPLPKWPSIPEDDIPGTYRIKAVAAFNQEPEVGDLDFNIDVKIKGDRPPKRRIKRRAYSLKNPTRKGVVGGVENFSAAKYACEVHRGNPSLRWWFSIPLESGEFLDGKIRTPRVSDFPDTYEGNGFLVGTKRNYFRFVITKVQDGS